MHIVEPYVYVPQNELSPNKISLIERYGRVCYKSEEKTTDNSADSFVKRLIQSGHESVIEHEKASVLVVTDRGVSHELVRHRIGSYSQESTRYCNYSNSRFGSEITVIRPFYLKDQISFDYWKNACQNAEKSYFNLLRDGKPQEARAVLPNSLKTEIVITYNFREWRHFFKLRCSSAAHPQMRQIAIPLLLVFKEILPSLFFDIMFDTDFLKEDYAKVSLTDPYFVPISDIE